MLMDASPQNTATLRQALHDINGEIFLIRGNAEIALHQLPKDTSQLVKNLEEIIARTEILEGRVRDLRKQLINSTQSSKEIPPRD